MLKVIVKQKPILVDQSNVPNIWFQSVDKLLMFGLSKTSFLAFVVDYIQHLEWYPRQDFMLRILLILLANKSSVTNLDNYSNDLLGCFFLSCTELLLSIKSLGLSII